MKFLRIQLLYLSLPLCIISIAQKAKTYTITSPDGAIVLREDTSDRMLWFVSHKSQSIIAPSPASLQLTTGETLGNKASITSAKTEKVAANFTAVNCKKKVVHDNYNKLTLNCKDDYGIIFRACKDGVSYRFFTKKKGVIELKNEEVVFNFNGDYNTLLPCVRDFRGKEQYIQSFEALYADQTLSQVSKDTLAFLTVLVDVGNGKKVDVLDTGPEEYHDMVLKGAAGNPLKDEFAPFLTQQPINNT
ncbi:MAG: glycoside hydrolase family 97 N-terminal domain-containing protein [Ferruginibacter sp.]